MMRVSTVVCMENNKGNSKKFKNEDEIGAALVRAMIKLTEEVAGTNGDQEKPTADDPFMTIIEDELKKVHNKLDCQIEILQIIKSYQSWVKLRW